MSSRSRPDRPPAEKGGYSSRTKASGYSSRSNQEQRLGASRSSQEQRSGASRSSQGSSRVLEPESRDIDSLLLKESKREIEKYKDLQGIEVEVRFGSYDPRVTKGISREEYESLRRAFSTDYQVDDEVSDVDIYDDDIRRITVGKRTTWERKTRLWNSRSTDAYRARLTISKEEQIKKPRVGNAIMRRNRQRITYRLSENAFLELTVVTGGMTNDSIDTTYEAEIEFKGGAEADDFRQVLYVFSKMHGTWNAYAPAELDRAFDAFSDAIGAPSARGFPSSSLSKARNIKWDDLELGGIVGGATKYAVSVKADGDRSFLFSHQGKIWLLGARQADLLCVRSVAEIESLGDFILECEFVSKKALLVYDCLFWRVSLLSRDYLGDDKSRHAIASTLADLVRKSGAVPTIQKLEAKPVYLLSKDTYFTVLEKLVNEDQEHPDDGLIFTPANAPYRPVDDTGRFVDTLPVEKRFLSRYADICKWKPSVTIDFAIKAGERELYAWDGASKQLVPFVGSKRDPFNPEDVAWDEAFFEGLESRAVVEFEWRDGVFFPYRLREDKPVPNGISVALSNWQSIVDPIHEEDLTGHSIRVVRRYHNRIKQELLRQLAPGATLLDIGSGRGGDIAKWKSAELGHVYCVEPDLDNAAELEARLAESPMRGKVSIYKGGGEQTDNILAFLGKTKVDAVALMLSASFFWSKRDLLAALVDTIVHSLKPNGKLLIFTVDGDAVVQLFEPALNPEVTRDELMVADTYMKLHLPTRDRSQGRRLDIAIPGTIVGTQTEYCVFTSSLTARLAPFGLRPNLWKRARKMGLASPAQQLYTSLYSYCVYSATDLKVPRRPMPKELPAPSSFRQDKAPETFAAVAPIQTVEQLGGIRVSLQLSPLPDIPGTVGVWKRLSSFVCRTNSGVPHDSMLASVAQALVPAFRKGPRLQVLAKLRAQLAKSLFAKSKAYEGFTVWESSKLAAEAFATAGEYSAEATAKYILEKFSPEEHELRRAGVTRRVSDEHLIYFISEMFNVNLCILDERYGYLSARSTTLIPSTAKRAMILLLAHEDTRGQLYSTASRDQHYELIGIQSRGSISCLFSSKSSVVDWVSAHASRPKDSLTTQYIASRVIDKCERYGVVRSRSLRKESATPSMIALADKIEPDIIDLCQKRNFVYEQ